MPARISDEVVERVKALWGEYRDRSTRKLWALYRQRHGGQLSLRKLQEIVHEARKDAPKGPFPLAEWQPWQDKTEEPESSAYLLRLDASYNMLFKRHLYSHEAAWGRRLRVILEGVHRQMEVLFVHEYGVRDVLAFNFQQPQSFTDDLDSLLALKPWLPGHRELYELLVTWKRILPPPGYHSLENPDADWILHPVKPKVEHSSTWDESEFWQLVLLNLGLNLEPPLSQYKVYARFPFLIWMFGKVIEHWAKSKEWEASIYERLDPQTG